MAASLFPLCGVLFFHLFCYSVSGAYYGKLIGQFNTYAHGVRGKVYAASNSRLTITEFYYDGSGPDAFAWMGSTNSPSSSGTIIPVDGRTDKLPNFNNAIVNLDLPNTLNNYKWLSIWCRRFRVSFGDLSITSGFAAPAPMSLGSLGFTRRVHNVYADEVIVLNHRQLQIVNLDYDGNGPDAYYWAGTGSTPSRSGFALADESRGGSTSKIPGAFNDKTLMVTLPSNEVDIFGIGHFGLWCVLANQDFGHVDIPAANLLNVPPYDEDDKNEPPPPKVTDNCEVLIDDTYQVQWTITGSMIEVTLSARINPGTYMAFGLSGSDSRTTMLGSDVTVAWLDAETGGTASAVDYHLTAYQQCVLSSGSGACPDANSIPRSLNDVTVQGYSNANGIIAVTYTRQLNTSDSVGDKVIPTDREVYVAWAIGPITTTGLAAKHRQSSSNVRINFGQASSSCPAFSSGTVVELDPWEIPELGTDGTTNFQFDIGQAGGQRGYEGITGAPGWGIAWYVNSYIIPVLTLKRGVTYTFTVNGGDDSSVAAQANYHPLYITDDIQGGYAQKTVAEKQGIQIYAGPVNGSLCEWRNTGVYNPDDYDTFLKYRNAALQRQCNSNNPATLTWMPDENTPDTVYYQCYTHKFLGWKINIVDNQGEGTSAIIGIAVAASIGVLFLIGGGIVFAYMCFKAAGPAATTQSNIIPPSESGRPQHTHTSAYQNQAYKNDGYR